MNAYVQGHLAFLSISYRTAVLMKVVQCELLSFFHVYDRQLIGIQLRVNRSGQSLMFCLYLKFINKI